MNIILSGLPFIGKTTIGKEISQLLDWGFIDTDTIIENRYGQTCRQIYAAFGKEKYRKMENEVLQEIHLDSQKIISLGGGTLVSKDNAALVKTLGYLVCLQTNFKTLFQRLLDSKSVPAYLSEHDLEGSFRTLIQERDKDYRIYADLLFDITNKTPKESAQGILKEKARHHGN